MKKRNILSSVAVLGVLLLSSCNTFLDKVPDQRTEIDNEDKVTKLLVSAYSVSTPGLLHDFMSDNYTDLGANLDVYSDIVLEAYMFDEKITSTAWDTPYAIWEDNYKAIAAANMALAAIEELEGEGTALSAQKAEALLCRAYAHFTLVSAFCQAYNTQSSASDLGIPYMYGVETTAINHYERGTVAEVYKNINDDIEEALPMVDDGIYSQPKYHFNRRAAYAFAAKFNLYYGNYEKAAGYATQSLGEDPSGSFRDWSIYNSLTARAEITAAWINSEEPANIFFQGLSSLHGRNIGLIERYSRVAMTTTIANEIISSSGPWSGYLNTNSYTFGSGNRSFFPKRDEYFVYTDVAEGTGQLWNLVVQFSVEKTLLDRAEAYTMMGEYELAARDLNYFYECYGGGNGATLASINAFYAGGDSRYVKDINPRFDLQAGMQTNLIHACLHARRIAEVHEGGRLLDIKRFGIRYTHVVDNGADLTIEPYDSRLAIQIPDLVVSAGMQKNPR